MRRWQRTVCEIAVFAVLIGSRPLTGAFQTAAPATRQAKASADPIDYATARFERVVHALRITSRITIDGRLDEPAWETAEPATNFVQWEPEPGMPSSER